MVPEGLEERLRELRRRPAARAALRADREAAVETIAFGTLKDLWVPRLPLEPRYHEPPPRPLDEPVEDGALAGLAADGRPVLVRDAFGLNGERPAAVVAHPSEQSDNWVLHSRLLTWSGQRLEVVGFLTHEDVSHVSWIDHDHEGRPVAFATAGVPVTDLEQGVELVWCDWEGDRCMRMRVLANGGSDVWHPELVEGDYDAAGLDRIRSANGDPSADPEAALASVDGLTAGDTEWHRAFHGAEEHPLPAAEALEVWVDSVAAAAQRAVAEADPREPWVIKVNARFGRGEQPGVVIAERSYRDRTAGRVAPRDAVWQIWDPALPLLPHVDDAGLRAWRSLVQQRAEDDQPEAAVALQRRLAGLSWPGGAPALAFGLDYDIWRPSESMYGRERLDALLGAAPGAPAVRPPSVAQPPASRGELAALLMELELPPTLAEDAAWGLALLGDGTGASRLGGPPALPEGTAWPVAGGRALTHLATIAFSELPDFEGRDLLAADGALVFFADLTEEGELVEPAPASDERVRILHVPAGAVTHEPHPPHGRREPYDPDPVLALRPIRFEPVLTLRPEPEGLSRADELVYEQLYDALWHVAPGAGRPPHLLLGHPEPLQEDPREPGEASLLHVGWDEELGFDFLDAGDLTFHGDPADVRAGRWERLTVSPGSG